jgi:hypothetical protein
MADCPCFCYSSHSFSLQPFRLCDGAYGDFCEVTGSHVLAKMLEFPHCDSLLHVYMSLIVVLNSILRLEICGSHRYSIKHRIYPAVSPKEGDKVFGKVALHHLFLSPLLLVRVHMHAALITLFRLSLHRYSQYVYLSPF